uniref:Uncharacterized protein n=1 Tax=Solanum tuberosum TaxID=4113 RepID=M1DJD2_SOLTU
MCSSESLGFGQGQYVRIRLPGATLRVPEEDPNLGQASCQNSLPIALRGNSSVSWTSSPREQLRVADSFRDKNAEISKSIFTSLKSPTKTPLKKIGASRRRQTLQGFNSDFCGEFVNKVMMNSKGLYKTSSRSNTPVTTRGCSRVVTSFAF